MTRQLPDFVVVGALRAGTTTLYSLLGQVEGICVSDIKETDYFIAELNHKKGYDWYRGLFRDPTKICGDVSPNYSTSDRFPGVAERLKAASPGVKIVYVVRDPVDRARSHYQHTWLKDEQIAAPDQLCETAQGRHIIEASMYYRQIAPFAACFPREQIMIVDFDDLRTDPHGVLRRVVDFVGAGISEAALAAIDTSPQNSSKDLAALPGWWLHARRSLETRSPALFRAIRAMVPSGVLSSLRKAMATATPDRKPPTFSSDVISRVEREVAEDAAQFRQFSGKNFPNWSV
ncbi:MAG: sulfotransferase domain-containing protein [Pseudomonadota bacterium]